MKILYRQNYDHVEEIQAELTTCDLNDSIKKTRRALEIAYAGFDNALETDLIDSYIYEINSLQKKYEHLTKLAAAEANTQPSLHQHSPIRTLVSHIFGKRVAPVS